MNTKKLFLMMLAALLLGSSRAHETDASKTIIRVDKNELVQAGDFSDAFFNIVTQMTGDFLELPYYKPNYVPILVRYSEGAGNEANIVALALDGIRERLYGHGINGYNNDNLNPATPYS